MKLALLGLGFILLLAVGMFFMRKTQSITSSDSGVGDFAKETEKTAAIEAARNLYEEKKRERVDFSSGPCLAEAIVQDWSFDLVHNPRINDDDDPINQCSNYLNKSTNHIVEFDIEGNLVQAL